MWTDEPHTLAPHLVQNSPEWHAYRRLHIGASDVPSIMGTSDWGNAHGVWLAKAGDLETRPEDKAQTWPQIRGHMLEPIIISHFELRHGCRLTKPVKEFSAWPVLIASLDGWYDAENAVVECKAPAIWKHTMALCGLIPETYVDQLQAQICVSGADFAYYVSFHDKEPESHQYAEVKVYRDQERINQILERCEIFWEMVLEKRWRDDF